MKNYLSLSLLKLRHILSHCLIVSVLLLIPLQAIGGDYHSRRQLPKQQLNALDKAIKASGLYMGQKMKQVDSVRTKFLELPEENYSGRWQLAYTLSGIYLPMRADSALHYSEIAIEIARQSGLNREENLSFLMRINALSTAGIFTRALDDFRRIDADGWDLPMKILYWSAARKLYGYMKVYVEGDKEFYDEYTEKYFQYDDSIVNNLPANDPTRIFYVAERDVERGRYPEAKRMLEQLCNQLPENNNLYGMAAFQLGVVHNMEGDSQGYASWLAKAAISDIKGCVKDGLALPTLAEWLYHEGELQSAFQYINFALEDAMSGNVRMRTVTIAALLPVIDEAYKEKVNASRDELMIYFLLVTFLLLITVSLIIVLMRMIKRGKINAEKLNRTARLQESYIGHFVGLCSTYASRLESLQKLIVRKISAGQSDELLRLVKSGKFAEDTNEDFYKIFDAAFLEIYPDYLENINALLRHDEQLELKKNEELTPELRIYAFVRLGVEESTKIAQILNYSVSTVYAYRNRMRNRAVDRENFDRNVMSLGKKDF